MTCNRAVNGDEKCVSLCATNLGVENKIARGKERGRTVKLSLCVDVSVKKIIQ